MIHFDRGTVGPDLDNFLICGNFCILASILVSHDSFHRVMWPLNTLKKQCLMHPDPRNTWSRPLSTSFLLAFWSFVTLFLLTSFPPMSPYHCTSSRGTRPYQQCVTCSRPPSSPLQTRRWRARPGRWQRMRVRDSGWGSLAGERRWRRQIRGHTLVGPQWPRRMCSGCCEKCRSCVMMNGWMFVTQMILQKVDVDDLGLFVALLFLRLYMIMFKSRDQSW